MYLTTRSIEHVVEKLNNQTLKIIIAKTLEAFTLKAKHDTIQYTDLLTQKP